MTRRHSGGALAAVNEAFLARAPKLIARISWLLGVLTILSALVPFAGGRAQAVVAWVGIYASQTATSVVAVSGLVLLRVAAGLRKRKHLAWQIAVAVSAVMTVAHVVKGHRPIEAVLSASFLVMLLLARSRFTAKADPPSRLVALRVLGQFLAVAVGFGMAFLYLYPGHVVGEPSLGDRLREVLLGLIGLDGPVDMVGDRFGDIFHGTMLTFGLVTVVVVALLLLRPVQPIAALSDADEGRLRDLLVRQGQRDSLGYFALRRDKSVVWSPSGKSAITYRVVQGVALISGDPLGDPEAWPGAIAQYQRLVDDYAWTPAVIGCSELGATVYKRELDLQAYALGDEAIVEVSDFCLDGRSMRGVRQPVGRVARAGYEVCVRRAGDIDPSEMQALIHDAAAWRGSDVERGFSMALSRLGDPADPDCVVVTATQGGQVRGLLHFVPWGLDGLSLDLMRRDRAADNGLNEFLIVRLIQACPELKVRRLSLNFVVFRDALERGERIGAGPVLRLWRAQLIFLSRFWQIESLYRFNVKFRPEWEPRFLSYSSPGDLPRIALAALEAEAFLVRPHRLQRMLGRG